ncbi:pentapeptide repeat-containing protein [Pararhizobium sp. A13]|uniref:pentapeptide repeat-containing protein n=1 Tax=Pararhizobium sp. A13 TaxID=3133975 RepID=UPI00324C8290
MRRFVNKYSAMARKLPFLRKTVLTVLPPAPLASALLLSASLFSAQPAMASDCGSTPAPGLDWSECTKKSLMLPSSELEGANLFGTDFSLTDLSGSNLTSANLEKANLVRAWLAGARAEKANFARVEAYRSSFVNIVANGASFAGAELQRADFSGAQLTGADFEKAELGRAHFKGAVLTGTRFSLANLSRADLSGTTFEGPLVFDQAFLYLTRIEGLDLSAAKGLEQAQVDLACGDDKTKLPAGLTAPSSWPCGSD